jgi:hypothetical protein
VSAWALGVAIVAVVVSLVSLRQSRKLAAESLQQSRELAGETRRLDRRKENRQDLQQRFDEAETLLKAIQEKLPAVGHQADAKFPDKDIQQLLTMTDVVRQLDEEARPSLETPEGISLTKEPLYKLDTASRRAFEAYKELPEAVLGGRPPTSPLDRLRVEQWEKARDHLSTRAAVCLGYINENRSKWRNVGT